MTMTKSNNTKRALLMSILSMMLCCAMLVGTTYAWFTDSVNSGKNRIVAGSLDVQLFYKTGNMTDWRDVESLGSEDADPFFRNAEGNKILWEPGAIGITSFKVENVGTLAFKYALALFAVKYNQLDGRDLRDVIKFAVIDGELPEDFTAEKAQNLDYSMFPDFTKRSALRPKDGNNAGKYQEFFTVVAYWKPNSDSIDNLYNPSNGKFATELDGTPSDPSDQLYLDIDIRLNAWQDTVESDSFDEQYDAMADAYDTFPDGCYAVTDHGTWVELDIYTGRSTADINISYTGYAPDNTDERMREWTTDSSGTITPTVANGNTHLIFFKTADKGNFILTQDSRVLPVLQVKEDGTPRRIVYSARKAARTMAMSADLSNAVSVSNEAEMQDVISNLNTNGGEKIVKLSSDINLTEKWELTRGTLTILGERHSITCDNLTEKNFFITNTATLNLGADDYDGTLTVKASSGTRSPLLSVSGNACVNICQGTTLDGLEGWSDMSAGGLAISDTATVNMYGGSIRNCNGRANAGGVFLSGSAKFNLNAGEITNCSGILGGAVGMSTATSFGGSTTACNAVFTMNGGTISDCSSGGFAASGWDNYTIGGAAVCMYGNVSGYKPEFIMNGGLITGCSTDVANAQSDVYGGAILVSGGNVTLNGGKITKNTVTTGNGTPAYGGGISAHWCGNTSIAITIEDSFQLYNNSAQTAGDDISNSTTGSTRATLKLKNLILYGPNNVYAEHTGGKWYTDEAGNREGSPIQIVAFNDNVTVKKYFIKVVHEEEPEPVYETYVFKYGFDGHKSTTTEERSFEQGADIEFPDPTTKGYIFNRWIFDDTQYPNAYIADYCPLEGVGTPGRLLDLYNGTGDSAAVSKGGAKTVRWTSEYSSLATNVNASAPIKAGTKITMAYYPDKDNRTIVSYYYLIVPADITTISLYSFTPMGAPMDGPQKFIPNNDGPCGRESKEPIYQFSFVFPEEQENMTVWMSKKPNDDPNATANGSTVDISFSGKRIPVPSGKLEATGTTVTVSDLAGFEADQSDSRHNTLQDLAYRKVLAVEAVNAQGRTVPMSDDTVVTVGGSQATVSTGIAAAEITGDGTYTIDVELPQGAVGIRVSLCYTYNNIIYKPMANVLDFVTVKP